MVLIGLSVMYLAGIYIYKVTSEKRQVNNHTRHIEYVFNSFKNITIITNCEDHRIYSSSSSSLSSSSIPSAALTLNVGA